jgi:hypothetical protein
MKNSTSSKVIKLPVTGKNDKRGILQTATTEKCVIDGEIYVVGDLAKTYITKILAGSEVIYTVKEIDGVKRVAFIKPSSAGVPASATTRTEHTTVSKEQMEKEQQAYNEKAAETALTLKLKKPTEGKDTSPICLECVEFTKCTIRDPRAGCAILADVQSAPVLPGAVDLGMHINMGSFCNFDVKASGVDVAQARTLLLASADAMIEDTIVVMQKAADAAKRVRYDR